MIRQSMKKILLGMLGLTFFISLLIVRKQNQVSIVEAAVTDNLISDSLLIGGVKDYSSSMNYLKGDLVSDGGNLYECMLDTTTGQKISDSVYWRESSIVDQLDRINNGKLKVILENQELLKQLSTVQNEKSSSIVTSQSELSKKCISLEEKLTALQEQITAIESKMDKLIISTEKKNMPYHYWLVLKSTNGITTYNNRTFRITSASGAVSTTAQWVYDAAIGGYKAEVYSDFGGNVTINDGTASQKISVVNQQENIISPYITNLTCYVSSSNTNFQGKKVCVLDPSGSTIATGTFNKSGTKYTTTIPVFATAGSYTVTYPFYIGNDSKCMNLNAEIMLNNSSVSKELFGNIQSMSFSDIQAACKAGCISSMAKVGDTISDGKYTYTIIGINQDTPCDSEGNTLKKGDQYKEVLTVACLSSPYTKSPMWANAYVTSEQQLESAWDSVYGRKTIMSNYLSNLPLSTQAVIGYVRKLYNCGKYHYISGYWDFDYNYIADKCFILSDVEVSGDKKYTYFSQHPFEKDMWLRYKTNHPSYLSFKCIVNGKLDSMFATESLDIYPVFCIY